MSLSLLVNAPLNVKLWESNSDLSVDPLEALAGEFFSDLTEGPDGLIIELDATLRLEHTLESESSENKIEEGYIVSDNYTPKPQRLTLTGTVTDTPITYLSFMSGGAGGFGALTNALKPLPPHIDAWFILKDLWYSGRPFDVATGLDLYKSMVISRLSAPQDAMIGRQLLFTAELKQQWILEKESTTPGNDLITGPEDVGYLTSQIPDAVSAAAGAIFLAKILEII